MATRKLKNGGRCRAQFGAEAGAILAAAGINAATQLAAAGINSAATKDAAQRQAQALREQANKQADALKLQNEKANELQMKSQDFVNQQNAENRELQKDIQMQLQMLTGQQNTNDRLEAAKIQVRNGGSIKRKLRLAGNTTSSLRGNDNIPFVVTDGGGVIPVGTTPEGFDLYEISGNDHEHYHRARKYSGGNYKSGVGIKFADGSVIEGEGNQNTNQGEYMLTTPENAYFISKHSIAGFNPAKMINGGMHPLKAYAIQERLKAINGISDDGKHNSSPVEKKLLGGQQSNLINMINSYYPELSTDTVGATAAGAAYATNEKRKLRNGGRCRRRADFGTYTWQPTNYSWPGADMFINSKPTTIPVYAGPLAYEYQPTINSNVVSPLNVTPATANSSTTAKPVTTRGGGWGSPELWGAGITALGNIGGALITSLGNRRGTQYIANAENYKADLLANAYRNLVTIDDNTIDRSNYAAAHALASLQAPVSFANQRIAKIDRMLGRMLDNARRYSLSGVAAIERSNLAEINAQDSRNQVYSEDQEQMQRIRQANQERLNQVAMFNAQQDNESNRQYFGDRLKLAQYNNDIINQRILGSAGALGEGAVNVANAYANAATSNASTWAQSLVGSSQGFANSLTNMATRKADLEKVLLGATSDSQASYYANPRLSSYRDAANAYNRLVAQWNKLKDSPNDSDREYADILKRQINNIASGRNLKMV